jgi:hypothetical protein
MRSAIKSMCFIGIAGICSLAGCSDGQSETPSGGERATGGRSMARLRVAHLSPDAPPVDVCLDPGTGFVGPVLKAAGDTNGLAYAEVTTYVEVAAATYTARIVAPNAADCMNALGSLPDVTGIAAAPNTDYTVAALGMLTPAASDEAFRIKVFVDDNAPTNGDKGYVRFIHASPDTPAVDVGTGSGDSFTAIWTNVEFENAGPVEGENYLETDPLNDVTVSARASGADSDALVIRGVDLPAGAVATAFAIGNLDADPKPLNVLLCVDSAAAPSCSIVP